MARLEHDGYGMLETNLVDFSIMESQCEVDETAFPDGVENGTIVGVDKAAKKLVKPTDDLPKALMANSERIFNQYAQGLKNFHVEAGEMGSALYLRDGFRFTTNTVGSTEFATSDDLIDALEDLATTRLYAKWDANGILDITATAAGAAFEVVAYTTMPDGQPAIKVNVIREGLLSAQ